MAKQPDAANAQACAAVLQDSTLLPAINMLAIVYLRTGDLAAGAEKHLRQAIEHSGSAALGARYNAELATLKGPRRQ